MWLNNSIQEYIYSTIQRNIDESECINLEGSFEEIGIGSINFIKILVEIENHYNIEVEEHYYMNYEYKNVKDFIDTMDEYVSNQLKNNLK